MTNIRNYVDRGVNYGLKSFIILAQWVNLKLTNFHNKLECFILVSLSSLVYCLGARPGAYPRVEYLKDVSLG
jgi:hypothetical protein